MPDDASVAIVPRPVIIPVVLFLVRHLGIFFLRQHPSSEGYFQIEVYTTISCLILQHTIN